jgi:hypothetical protein
MLKEYGPEPVRNKVSIAPFGLMGGFTQKTIMVGLDGTAATFPNEPMGSKFTVIKAVEVPSTGVEEVGLILEQPIDRSDMRVANITTIIFVFMIPPIFGIPRL